MIVALHLTFGRQVDGNESALVFLVSSTMLAGIKEFEWLYNCDEFEQNQEESMTNTQLLRRKN